MNQKSIEKNIVFLLEKAPTILKNDPQNSLPGASQNQLKTTPKKQQKNGPRNRPRGVLDLGWHGDGKSSGVLRPASPVKYPPGVLSHVPLVSCHMSSQYPVTCSHFVQSSFIFTHFVFHIGAVCLQFCLVLPKKHPSAGQKPPRAPHETPKTPQRATQRPS